MRRQAYERVPPRPATVSRVAEPNHSEQRLVDLWSGEFGDDYVERNIAAERGREGFWTERLDELQPASALEVGCNVGGNLRWVADRLGQENAAGVDVNEKALSVLRARFPGIDARRASGTGLPFGDGEFELAYTIGVLIHQDPAALPDFMREIVRCSARWILCGEYYADEPTEVPYRGHEGALFK